MSTTKKRKPAAKKPKPASRAKTNPRSKVGGKRTRKKPGAQTGNKNALKHGFYSRHFKDDEKTRLTETNNLDVDSEIALLRVFIDRLTAQMPENFAAEESLKALNTLSLMVNSQSTLIRTHYLIRGKGSEAEKSILTALEELRMELGI